MLTSLLRPTEGRNENLQSQCKCSYMQHPAELASATRPGLACRSFIGIKCSMRAVQ